MSRILTNEKFRGDNRAVSKIWITQCEGHLRALEIENEKRLDILLCCLEGSPFSYLRKLRTANTNITYAQVKDESEQRFCGDEYKRNLQIKSQNLKFV